MFDIDFIYWYFALFLLKSTLKNHLIFIFRNIFIIDDSGALNLTIVERLVVADSQEVIQYLATACAEREHFVLLVVV